LVVAGGAIQYFQHGWIYWTPNGGAVAV
jgi:uncharacterized protein with LGFP repeats